MKIHVRRRHIERGKVHARECPIALAFLEATGLSVFVCADAIAEDIGVYRPLPPSAKLFITRFDSGKPVKPFAFVLK